MSRNAVIGAISFVPLSSAGRRPHWYMYRDLKRLHQRTGILSEALLARHECVAVMKIFHLPLLEVVGETDIMMRGEQKTCAFALEPLADGLDLFRRRFLLGKKVIKAKHQERVGVGQNPFVNWQLIARLVDALEHSNWMAGYFARQSLEAER